jgi:glycosyltransferase involved in cell wall biosynthesis
MKILFNCVGLKPLFFKRGGGSQKSIGYLLLEVKDQHQVIVAGQMAENKEGIQLIPYKRTPSVMTIPDFLINGILCFLKIRRVEADIIVSTHERNFLPSFLYSKLKKKPMIAYETDHDFWVPPFIRVKKLYQRLINQVERVVAVSPSQKRRMLDRGIAPDRIVLINNYTDTRQFSPPPDKQRKKHPPYLLNVAKFTPRKNQLLLLEAFKGLRDKNPSKYSDLELYLVGPGTGAFTAKRTRPSPYYKKCLEYIKKHSLEQKVTIFENVTDGELVELYRNAALFAFPSFEEGFGLTLLEAMACGCPCLANNIETSLDIMGDVGIPVDVNDMEKFTGQIERLLEDDALRKELAAKGRQRAVSMFDLSVAGKQFKALLNSRI